MSLPAPDIRANAADELLGQTLADRFRLDSVLGHGAMGAVFKAHHLGLKKDVALKLLHRELTANDEMVARFDREAAAASRLDHPNCVRIMDFGSTKDGRRYLVMECLEGKDLAEIVTEAMPPFRVVELIRQVLEGLAHAHAQGLVHRDIKPENIFVLGSDGGEQVKLLDFGIAKITHGAGAGQLTRAGMIFGTPYYMSPEQARGEKTDARSDLYALGVVMYSMLTGELPFDGDDPVAILRRQIAETPPALPDSVPGSLRHFVMRLLAKKPEERFADATAAIAALRRAASPTDRAAKPKLPPPPRLGGLPGGLARPKPPTITNTVTPAPRPGLAGKPPATDEDAKEEAEEVELPDLEELVAMESGGEEKEGDESSKEENEDADDDVADQDAATSPPPAPAVVPGGTMRVESEERTEPEPKKAPAPPPPPPGAAAAPVDRPPWVLPAIGVGAVGLLMLAVAAWPDGDETEAKPKAAAADGATKDDDSANGADKEESKDEPADAKDDDSDTKADSKDSDELVIDDDPAVDDGEEKPAEDQSVRALRANLASIDALLDAKKYDTALTFIGPLMEVFDDSAALHWRMGRALVGRGLKSNATPALEAYRSALSLDRALLDNEEFASTFWVLLDNPRHRELATTIAIELLGDTGHDRLATWVNVQKSPLSFEPRHAAIDHLRSADEGKRINEPLQIALDLWQAGTTKSPCETFSTALEAATDKPDSYLLGTLAAVSVPTTGEGDAAAECPGIAESLTSARDDYGQRYAGLDPIVPSAYRRRGGKSSNGRRRR